MKLAPLQNLFSPSTLRRLRWAVLLVGLWGVAFGVQRCSQVLVSNFNAKTRMSSAYQIWICLHAYGENNEGVFPSDDVNGNDLTDSNAAYRMLFVRDWVDDEQLFFVSGCPWHKGKQKPDRIIGTLENGFAQALESGENHWGYVKNRTVNEASMLPLLMDGGVLGKPGQWTEDPAVRGGVTRSRYAVIIRVGGSARAHSLDEDYRARELKDGKRVDIFSPEYGTQPADCLNPLQ
jgi:hypothetical protein